MSVIKMLRTSSSTMLALDAGGLAEKRAVADSADKFVVQLEVLDQAGYAAVNLAPQDLEYVQHLRYKPEQLVFVSANLKNPEKLPIAVRPWMIYREAGKKIGIMGLFLEEHEAFSNAVSALEAELPALRQQVDVVVVLAYGQQEAVRALAEQYPDIDIAVSNSHAPISGPKVVWNGEQQVVLTPALRGKSLVGIQFDLNKGMNSTAVKELDYVLGDEQKDDATTREVMARRSRELAEDHARKEHAGVKDYLNLSPEQFMNQYKEDRL